MDNIEIQKEEIISSIKQQIIYEHKNLGWEEIAARKIYATHFSGISKTEAKTGDYCAVCGSRDFHNDEEE